MIIAILSLCSWEVSAQETLMIYTKSGVIKSISFAQKPELFFDKTDVIRVVTAGSMDEILFSDINLITFEDGKGNVNDDTEINEKDVTDLTSYLMGKPSTVFIKERADVNGDGEVNVADIVALIGMIRRVLTKQ